MHPLPVRGVGALSPGHLSCWLQDGHLRGLDEAQPVVHTNTQTPLLHAQRAANLLLRPGEMGGQALRTAGHTSALIPCNTGEGQALRTPSGTGLGRTICAVPMEALHKCCIFAFFRAAEPNSADYGLHTQRIPRKAPVCSSPTSL